MLTPAVMSTQVIQIDHGAWYYHSNGFLRPKQPLQPAPHLRLGYYALIDTHYQPDIDLKDLK